MWRPLGSDSELKKVSEVQSVKMIKQSASVMKCIPLIEQGSYESPSWGTILSSLAV